ncbi:peptidoglycan editing factor PgeF [Paenibacillus nanensis]|uniref:Purine nucleoside phosphorylase n=1 Tax=Paenibacillus nanensis TaxID=393251 RepID=A0A3A1VG75_9BACL|nr:peptidoglycan editing factor PgeF [Paenibacillus nanensis]RIX59324.1 peptidoglycan editing factor PgeF [Paenibacillus nanensis]
MRQEPFVQNESRQSAKEPSLFLLSPWLSRDSRLTAGFSGREGGVSSAPWDSLNIGLHVGDAADAVIANRKRLTDKIGWPFEAWTCAEQVHGNRVAQITADERGRGREALSDAINDCDAIMTNVPGVLLASFYADCVPLYFYAPSSGAVALAHAGWRGTVKKIAEETVQAMKQAYGTEPEELLAAIGPSIGSCCYEVDGAVITEVDRVLSELRLEEADKNACMRLKSNGKADLNLKEINRQIMIKAGILPSRIELTNWCTGCRTDLFFSHRTEGGRTGRMASWIGIRER